MIQPKILLINELIIYLFFSPQKKTKQKKPQNASQVHNIGVQLQICNALFFCFLSLGKQIQPSGVDKMTSYKHETPCCGWTQLQNIYTYVYLKE